VTAWVLIGIANSGFVNAGEEHQFDFIADKRCERYRFDLAWSIGWSVFAGPIGAAMTPFMTGFYEHGWRLSRRADCEISATLRPSLKKAAP
jgi:hypothetical protein